MRIYLSGPMSNVPDHNFPAFHSYAKSLRALGYIVISPAEMDEQPNYEDYLREDVKAILEVDAVAVMPGWVDSKGCFYETTVATAIGVPVLDADEMLAGRHQVLVLHQPRFEIVDDGLEPLPPQETILQEAQRLVHGDRGEDYGHPWHDFSRTSQMWSAIFGVDVTPEQVALAMVCVKISRLMNAPKRDSVVDIAGYAETLSMVMDYRQHATADQ